MKRQQKDCRHYLDKPKLSLRTLSEIGKLPAIANCVQVESQGTIFLQITDILLGALAFVRADKKDKIKRKLANEVLKVLLGNKKATANSVCVAKGSFPQEKQFVKWAEIVSIETVGRRQVYDLAIEATHNFVANGIVAHNTTSIAMRAGAATLEASNLGTSSTTADIQLYAADSLLASVGDLTLQASEDSTYPIILRSAQGGIQLSTQSADNGNLTLYSAGTLTLDSSRNNTNIILSPGTGNVGIGTTSPS